MCARRPRAAPLHLIGICGNRKKEGRKEAREGGRAKRKRKRDAISHHSIYLSGGGFIYKKCEEKRGEERKGEGGMDGSASHSLTHSLSTLSLSLSPSLPPPSKMEEPLLLYSMPRKSNTTTINTPSATDSIYLSLSLSLGLEGGGRAGEEKVIAPPPLPMRRRCRYCRRRRR